MATNLYYNGVMLRNVWIRDFEQTPIRDDSGTDILHQRFFVSVETVVNPLIVRGVIDSLGLASAGRPISPSTAGEALASARRFLAEDRGNFLLEMEGRTILTSSAATDANNGPKVIHLRTIQVSPETIKIQFAIEICKIDCTEQPSAVISNRWSCVDDTDDLRRITRTWRGKLRVSNAVKNPQDFRGLCIPVLQKGWRRTRLHFVGEANALELGYEVTDVQMIGEAAPSPGLKMSYTHTEALGQVGNLNTGDMVVRIDGGAGADKREMVERAVQVLVFKLVLSKFSEKKGIYKHLTIIEHGGEDVNAVEARATVMRIPNLDSQPNAAFALGNILVDTFGKPLELPEYDPQQGVWLSPYGDGSNFTTAGLFACHLQSPCVDNHGMPQIAAVETGEDGEKRSNEAPAITISDRPLSDKYDAPGYSNEHSEAVYTHAEITSQIIVGGNRVQLPIATADESANETAKIVTLAPKTAKLVIEASLERIGDQPQIVRPDDFEAGGIAYKLLCFKAKHHAPEFTGDGRTTYGADVQYTYAMSRPLRASESTPIPPLPWDTKSKQDTAFPPSAYLPTTGPKGFG